MEIENYKIELEVEIGGKKYRNLTDLDKEIYNEGVKNSLINIPHNFAPFIVVEELIKGKAVYHFVGISSAPFIGDNKVVLSEVTIIKTPIGYVAITYIVLKTLEVKPNSNISIQPVRPGDFEDLVISNIGISINPIATLFVDNKPVATYAIVTINNDKNTSFPFIFLLDDNGQYIIPRFDNINIPSGIEDMFIFKLALYANYDKIEGRPEEYNYIKTISKIHEIGKLKYQILASRINSFTSYNFYIDVYFDKFPVITDITKNY